MGGKTGTTNDFRSAWFVGFTPDIVVGVFVGFDDNRSLGNNETGAVDAVPIFIDFMQNALKDTPVHDFVPPPDAKFAMVNGNREAFRPGTEPTRPIARGPRRPAWPRRSAPNGARRGPGERPRPPPARRRRRRRPPLRILNGLYLGAARSFRSVSMRADVEAAKADIEQSIELLRRRL